MSLQTEAATYTRKDSFNFNKLSQSLPDTHAPLTMEDRKLSARGRNLLFGITGGDAGKSAPTNKPAYEPLERKSSLKGFHTTPSLGSFGSMQDLLRHTNSLKNMSIFDQTVRHLTNTCFYLPIMITCMDMYATHTTIGLCNHRCHSPQHITKATICKAKFSHILAR